MDAFSLLIEPSNRAILVVSSSKEMLPPLPSVDSVLVSSSAGVKLCGRTKIFICIPELEHWTGPTMVDSLFMFIACDSGLCFFFIFLYCGELTQCVYCGLFIIIWSNEKVCGIHICFWLKSVVCAVRLKLLFC